MCYSYIYIYTDKRTKLQARITNDHCNKFKSEYFFLVNIAARIYKYLEHIMSTTHYYFALRLQRRIDYFIATNINVCNVVFMMVAIVTNCYVSREFIAI